MPRIFALSALLLSLAGCDTLGSGDPFADDYYSVYTVTLSDGTGEAASGRIGLELVPSDVASLPDLWRGVWDLDAEADVVADRLDGRGAFRGGEADPLVLRFFLDLPERGLGPPERPAAFRLVVTDRGDADRLGGTWEATDGDDVVASGPFEAVLVRAATRFIVAG